MLLLFCLLPFAKAAAGACDAGWGVGCSGRAPCAPVCCIIATRVRVVHSHVTRVVVSDHGVGFVVSGFERLLCVVCYCGCPDILWCARVSMSHLRVMRP